CDVRLGENEETLVPEPQPAAAQADLRRRLFGAGVEDVAFLRGDAAGGLQEERRFPDPRLAADEHHRARNETAAENAIEAVQPGRQARPLLGLDVGDRE